MARPSKATVEYFPLVCQFGDSIQAIENIYGNDGFVVWVKLLQKLGRSDNHYIDVRTNTAWKLFYSIFKIEEHVVLNILDTLAELNCIDSNLWEHKIIYSENFVKGVSDAYRNRKSELLPYESILGLVGVSDVRNPQGGIVSDVKNPVSDVRNPQSKLKETKEKEIKEDILLLNERTANGAGNHTKEEEEIFKIPTLEEIRIYCKERNNSIDAKFFYEHYKEKNWIMQDGKPIRDWRAIIRIWERNEKKNTVNLSTGGISAASRPELQPANIPVYDDGVTPDEVDSEVLKQFREKVKKRL